MKVLECCAAIQKGISKNLVTRIRYLELAANIYNQGELQEWIDYLKEDLPITLDKWLDTVLRRYMLSEYEYKNPVTRVKTGDPEWAKKAVSDGTLETLDLTSRRAQEFKQNIEHALGYLKTVRDPQRIGVKLAIQLGNKLIEDSNLLSDSSEGKIQVIHEFDDGWTIVDLQDAKAIKREGKLMQHCAGQENQSYIKKVGAGVIELWSLRDPRNNPHGTIEYRVKLRKVAQIKGKQNEPIVRKYHSYLTTFLKTKKVNITSTELFNIGIIVEKGLWYNLFTLPEGFTTEKNLDLSYTEITSLPNGLTVGGTLNLLHCPITSLPEGLTVGKNLSLRGSNITSLPERLTVGGSLNLTSTSITSLPDGLTVGGSLYLAEGTTSLPEGLTVGGNLDLTETKITTLPVQFQVHGDLVLDNTSKISLPKDLKVKVGGDVVRF